MTINLYLIVMFAIPLLDAFDRVFARTAIRLDASSGSAMWPADRRICWGIISNARLDPGLPPRELRFFRVKLPIRTWGLTSAPWVNPYSATYGLRGHWLEWVEGGRQSPLLGFHITPRLEG